MELPQQKNFYDKRRYFQGKDNPNDQHPDAKARTRVPLSQLVFGVIFFLVVAVLFWMRIKSENGPAPSQILNAGKAPAAATPTAPAKR